MDDSCGVQILYWEDGVQRARFCPEPAVRTTEAFDGSRTRVCKEHIQTLRDAGARLVPEAKGS